MECCHEPWSVLPPDPLSADGNLVSRHSESTLEHPQPDRSVSQPQGLAPTHQLGAALNGLPDLEGFQAVSAKVPYHRTLAVFPKKLQAGSRITFLHPATGKKLTIRP